MPCGRGVGLIIYCPVAVQYLAGRGSCDESEVKALQVPLVMVPNALFGQAWELLGGWHLVLTDGSERDTKLFAKEDSMFIFGWHLKPSKHQLLQSHLNKP